MECEPRASVDVENLACPAASRVPEPMLDAPSLKRTVPVGVVGAAVVTVAVNVTVCPTPDGLADEATDVEVEA
jgi:hypothetical protein